MSVYFITCREIGFVKIGCAYDPFARLKTLQTAFPLELEIEALVEGAYGRERELHKQFSEHRHRGEWFRLHPDIESFMAGYKRPTQPKSIAQRRRILQMHKAEPPRNRTLSAEEKKYADIMAEMRAEKAALAIAREP